MPLDQDGFLVVNRDTSPPAEPEKEYPKEPPPRFAIVNIPNKGWTAFIFRFSGKWKGPAVDFLRGPDGALFFHRSKRRVIIRCWQVFDQMDETTQIAWREKP